MRRSGDAFERLHKASGSALPFPRRLSLANLVCSPVLSSGKSSPSNLRPPPMSPLSGRSSPHPPTENVLKAWQKSRQRPRQKKSDLPLAPAHTKSGLARPLTLDNLKIAVFLLSRCWWDVARTALDIHPIRAPAMIALTLVRGLLPAFLMYSRGTAVDEVM